MIRLKSLLKEQTIVSKWLDRCTGSTPTNRNWSRNKVTGLVDVNGDFKCNMEALHGRQLLSDFKGVRFGVVTGDFLCEDNKLTSLKGAPQTVGRNFNCSNNLLTSLEGAPQKVGVEFSCNNNKLTSLEGAPQTVGSSFFCQNNQLTSLKGAPRTVGWNFDCSNNLLTSLEGAPQTVIQNFICFNNSRKFTDADVRAVTKVSRHVVVVPKKY